MPYNRKVPVPYLIRLSFDCHRNNGTNKHFVLFYVYLKTDVEELPAIISENMESDNSNSASKSTIQQCDERSVCACNDEKPDFVECGYTDPCFLIRKLCDLIDEEFCTDMIYRHIIIVNDYIKYSQNGFFLADIVHVQYVLHKFCGSLMRIPEYYDPFRQLLDLCSKLPLITSDDLKKEDGVKFYVPQLANFFTFLGTLLTSLPEEELQLKVILAIHQLTSRHECVDMCRVPLHICYLALEESELPNTITRLIKGADKGLYHPVLRLIQQFLSISPKLCNIMIKRGCFETLMCQLDPRHLDRDQLQPFPDPVWKFSDGRTTSITLQISLLWTMVLHFKDNPSFERRPVPSRRAIWSLRYTLRIEIWKRNRDVRNNFVALICGIMTIFPSAPIIESGLAADLIQMAVATEKDENSWLTNSIYTDIYEDYELKKHLLLCLCFLSKYPAAIEIMKQNKVMLSVLKLIKPYVKSSCKLWPTAEYWELLMTSLRVLCVLAPILPHEFINSRGSYRIMTLLQCYLLKPYEDEALEYCLRILSFISATGEIAVLDDMRLHRAIFIILKLCNDLLVKRTLTSVTQSLLSYAFFVLETLLRNNKKDQMEYGENCIALVIGCLHRVLQHSNCDVPAFNRMVICVIDFLWESVVWDPTNSRSFVNTGGPYILLDVLEHSILPVQVIILGLLVDLCEEGACIPHLLTWRGGKGKKMVFQQLLAAIWRAEEDWIGVELDSERCITDPEGPLMGQFQRNQVMKRNSVTTDNKCSPSIGDMAGSVRPKIYGILTLLECRHEECVAIIRNQYKIDTEPLPVLDQLTLEVARVYLPLKMAEIWSEVVSDITSMGLRPVATDGALLVAMRSEHRAWACALLDQQLRILLQNNQNEADKKAVLAELHQECEAAVEAQALRRLQQLVRDSDRLFRRALKRHELASVARELARCTVHERPGYLHRTYFADDSQPMLVEQSLKLETVGRYGKTVPMPEIKVCEEEKELMSVKKRRYSKRSVRIISKPEVLLVDVSGLLKRKN